MSVGSAAYSGAGRGRAGPLRVWYSARRLSSLTASQRLCADRRQYRRPRQPAGRSRHHPLLFQARPRRPARRLRDRRSLQGALRHRPVPGRQHPPGGRPDHRHGGRKSGHQPDPVRGQHAGSRTSSSSPRSSRKSAARCRAPSCRPTCSASSRSIAAAAASTSPSFRRSSSCRTAASISSSRSRKATRPRSCGIDFVGNRAYSSWRLKDVVRTTQTNILSFLQSTNIYDQDRLEADRELLRRFYLKHGYIDVRIVARGRRIRSRRATASSSPSRSRKASSIASARSTSARTCAPSIPG